jgi:signal peptidase I
MSASSPLIPASIPCTSAAFAGLTSDLLRAGRALRFRAPGVSMQPLIRDGDVLLVRPVDASTVRVGDVVLFQTALGRVVVHRVIRVRVTGTGRWFTVQGDAVLRPDGEIPEVQVRGRVVAIERGAAYLDLRRPVMRLLGWAAALRSRWGLGRGGQFRRVTGFAKRLPLLDKYLA